VEVPAIKISVKRYLPTLLLTLSTAFDYFHLMNSKIRKKANSQIRSREKGRLFQHSLY
jgi:hypothetical protein